MACCFLLQMRCTEVDGGRGGKRGQDGERLGEGGRAGGEWAQRGTYAGAETCMRVHVWWGRGKRGECMMRLCPHKLQVWFCKLRNITQQAYLLVLHIMDVDVKVVIRCRLVQVINGLALEGTNELACRERALSQKAVCLRAGHGSDGACTRDREQEDHHWACPVGRPLVDVCLRNKGEDVIAWQVKQE
jgi:hypothetical protein